MVIISGGPHSALGHHLPSVLVTVGRLLPEGLSVAGLLLPEFLFSLTPAVSVLKLIPAPRDKELFPGYHHPSGEATQQDYPGGVQRHLAALSYRAIPVSH